MWALALQSQFLAAPEKLQSLALDDKSVFSADLLLERLDRLAFELDDPTAVLADDVVMVGVVGVVGIVEFVILAEIDFLDEAAGGQERQGTIDGCARDRVIALTGPLQQLISGEVLICAEDGIDDGSPL